MNKITLQFLVLATICCNAIYAQMQDRPNVLWITIEDTSPQFLETYGSNIVTTPAMDKLGKQGVIFRNAYSTGTVCAPSRSTIVTGCSTEAMGTGNHRSNYSIPNFIKGFPYYLRKGGYFTTNHKKTDYNIANEGAFVKEAWNQFNDDAGWWNRKPGQPFFSVFNFEDCHQSRTMNKPWLWYKETILDKLPDSLKVDPKDIQVPPFYRDSKEMRLNLSRVHNSLRRTDVEVGELLAKLEKDGLMDSTIIFIFADHGEGIPRGKTNSIAFGHRVPFYVWFPEKYKHLSPWGTKVVSDELICFEDLAPTILSLAGCDIPEYMKGRPFMGEKRKTPRQYVYGSRNRLDDSPGLERTVFDGRFVYSRNFYPRLPVLRYQKYSDVSDIVKTIRRDAKDGLLDSVQAELVAQPRKPEYLYDLKNDNWEIHNLAANPKYQKDLLRMRQTVKDRILEINDVQFLPEPLMLKRTQGSTAYQLRGNEKINPIKEIIEVAELVGIEKKQDKFLAYLKSDKEEIRYWAAVGLNTIGKKLELKKLQKQALLTDTSGFVRIEIATLLYKTVRDIEAKKVLDDAINSDDLFAIHHTIQQLIYIPEIAKDFVSTIKNRYQGIYKTDEKGFFGEVQGSIHMFLYLYNNQPLYYNLDKPWMTGGINSTND